MKTLYRPSENRWHKKDAWKTSAYAFVPYQTHFGELCGFADDIVAAGKGFGMHPHQNMEISTIVLQGKQTHKDDTGGEGILGGNAIQTMSAGKGIMHSEYNASETESFWSYQIWVYPKEQNVVPRHEKFEYQPIDKLNKVLLTISPDKRKGSAKINQDAFFSVSRIEVGKKIDYAMNLEGNGVYIHCAEGKVQIGEFTLKAGDALGIYEIETVQLEALADTELIFVEVPMERGVKV
ncbi:MAG: pirin family protein [Cytophagales bacterium]|nr:MAG: pirin family protein [Cytophagales bacterium]